MLETKPTLNEAERRARKSVRNKARYAARTEEQRAHDRDRERKNKKGWRERRRQLVDDRKLLTGCQACGLWGPTYLLDFHHKDPADKSFVIGSKINDRSEESIVCEMNKCVVLCSNCHRKVEAADLELLPQ